MAHDDLTDAGPLNTQSCKMHDQSHGEVDSEVKKVEASRAPARESEAHAMPIETASQVILKAFANSGHVAAKCMKVIEEGFEATRPQFDKATGTWSEIPDYKTRQAALDSYLAHTIGLPVQRTENLNLTGKLPGSEKRRPATPAMLAYYERELAKAKRQKQGPIKPEAGPTSEE